MFLVKKSVGEDPENRRSRVWRVWVNPRLLCADLKAAHI